MKTELKFKLFAKLKEEFESATDFENYSNLKVEFAIDDGYTTEEQIECDITITAPGEETNIRVSIDVNEKMMVNQCEDYWEEWVSYSFDVSNLWRQMFFSKQCKEK